MRVAMLMSAFVLACPIPAEGAPKLRSAYAAQAGKLHIMRGRTADAKGLFVLVGAYDDDAKRAAATMDRLARLLEDDGVDAKAIAVANQQLMALNLSRHAGAEALVARLKGSSLAASYVGHIGVVRVRGGAATRVALPHSIIEDFIRTRNVPNRDQESLRLKAPHRFVTVRSLGKKTQVPVETVNIQTQKGDRFIVANVDVLAGTSLPHYVTVLAATKEPEAAAKKLVALSATVRSGGSPAAIVIFVE